MEDSDQNKTTPEDSNGNRQTFKTTCRQFWLISKAFFGSERRHKARGFLIALLVLALAVGGIQILMSYAGRDFFTAIERKRPGAYWVALGWYLGSGGKHAPDHRPEPQPRVLY